MEADTLEMRAWRTLTSSPSAWYGSLFWSPLRCRFLAAFTMHFWIICCSDESTSAKSKTRRGREPAGFQSRKVISVVFHPAGLLA
jgi:hypothetical protein